MSFRQSLLLGSLILTSPWALGGCGGEQRGVDPGTNGTGGSAGSSGGSKGSTGGGSSGGEAGDSSGGTSAGGSSGGSGGKGSGGSGGEAPAHCMQPWSEPPAAGSCDLDALTDSGVTLQGDITTDMLLETGNIYNLSGPTRVMNGAVLTIQPCVKILGQSSESILAILPGSEIVAEGEADAPIVFTSSLPVGSRLPGDWGGLIILGNARSNQATVDVKPSIEGLVALEPYGSHLDDNNGESSGTLAYVRVEYAGRDLGNNNESNGITFGGVGSGTTMHHVMVSNSLDDCFEWFGGTMNADHLIALNCDDDMFDTDHGFSGRIQFAFGRQFPTTAESDSNGFEMDTASPFLDPITNMPVEPLTSAQWSNVTVCGQGANDVLAPPRLGAVLRRRVGGAITNSLFTGFRDGGLAVLDGSTIGMTHSLVFGNGPNGDMIYGAAHAGDTWLSDQEGNDTAAPEGFCDCWSDPPTPFPQTAIAGGATTGFPDVAADYVGAFQQADAASNWMQGLWVDWAAE